MMEMYKQVFAEFKEGTINSFYEKMYPELIIYASRLLGNEFAFLSEDCVQDAVFQAYQQRRSFSSPFQLKAYILVFGIKESAFSEKEKLKATTWLK